MGVLKNGIMPDDNAFELYGERPYSKKICGLNTSVPIISDYVDGCLSPIIRQILAHSFSFHEILAKLRNISHSLTKDMVIKA